MRSRSRSREGERLSMDPGLGIAGRQKPTSRLHPYVHLQRVREGLEVLLQFDRTVEQRDRGGLFKLSPCKCLFRIRKEGADESAPIELERNLKKDNSYTLLVVLTDGKPVFNLVEDYPPNPETSGIYVYNLLKDVPLQATVGRGKPPGPLFCDTHPAESRAGSWKNRDHLRHHQKQNPGPDDPGLHGDKDQCRALAQPVPTALFAPVHRPAPW